MKRILLVLPLFILLSCSEDNINNKSKRNPDWVWWEDAETGIGEWLRHGPHSTVDNGSYTLFYYSGYLFEKGKLVNGKNTDTIFRYDVDGTLMFYTFREKYDDYYINDGYHEIFNQMGTLIAKGQVENHKEHNQWKQYDDNGKMYRKLDCVRDTGWIVYFNKVGQITDSIYHAKGLNNFKIKQWFDNGLPKNICDYKVPVYQGISKSYYSNGQIKDSSLTKNGKGIGFLYQWDKNGNLKATGQYNKNSQLDGKMTEYHKSGKVKQIFYFNNGEPIIGSFKEYNEDGEIIDEK